MTSGEEKRVPRRLPADAGDGAAAGRPGVRDGKGPGAGPGDVPGRVLHYADGEHGHIHQPGLGNERVHRGPGRAVYGKPYLCRLLQPGDAGAGL